MLGHQEEAAQPKSLVVAWKFFIAHPTASTHILSCTDDGPLTVNNPAITATAKGSCRWWNEFTQRPFRMFPSVPRTTRATGHSLRYTSLSLIRTISPLHTLGLSTFHFCARWNNLYMHDLWCIHHIYTPSLPECINHILHSLDDCHHYGTKKAERTRGWTHVYP